MNLNQFFTGTTTVRRDTLALLALAGTILAFVLALAVNQAAQPSDNTAMYRGTDKGRTEVCIARNTPVFFGDVECTSWQDVTDTAEHRSAGSDRVIINNQPAAAPAPIIVQAPAPTAAPTPAAVRRDVAQYRTNPYTGRRQVCVSKTLPDYSPVYLCNGWRNVTTRNHR